MYTLNNDEKTSNWFVDLKEHSQVEQELPLTMCVLRNDSTHIAHIYLWGRKVGEVQRYSSDTFSGRGFEEFRVMNPDGYEFPVNSLFVQLGKDQLMSSQPFNPQWDLLEVDLNNHLTGCDSRVSLSPEIDMSIIKFLLNAQNSLTVQRMLAIAGNAVPGVCEVVFGADSIDRVHYAIPVDGAHNETLAVKKHIIDEAFDYIETNCIIVGAMYEFLDTNPIHTDVAIPGKDEILDTDLTNYYETTDAGVIWYIWPADEVVCTKLFFYFKTKATGGSYDITIQYGFDVIWSSLNNVNTAFETHMFGVDTNSMSNDIIRITLTDPGGGHTVTLKIHYLTATQG